MHKLLLKHIKTKMILFTISIFSLTPAILNAQLSGVKTIPGDYATIAAAITDLNTQGVGSGGVTFNVAAGYTESITAGLTITATGTLSDPIVFQKSGAGANPVITRTDAGTLSTTALGGAGDAVIRLEGTDYITFNGIDVAATDQGIEYGYLTHKPSGTDGCQYVTIQNCNITMTKGTSGYVIGIYIGNGTTSTSSATGVTVTATSGINSNITIIGNTITNVHAGIYVRGSSATGFSDSDVTIGQSGAGNTITNFGGGSATTTYGVYFNYVNNPSVAYNTITSATHGSTLYGIFYSSGVTGNVVGSNNSFNLANNSATSATPYIYNANTVTSETFNNNTFAAGTLSSTGTVYLIYASNATPNKSISNNSISGAINRTGASGSVYCYYNFGSPSSGTETISNNTFSNITVTGYSSLYGIYTYTATGQNRVCNNNIVSNLTGGTGSIIGIYVLSSNSNQVYGNNVYDITAGGTVYGLYFSGTNPTVYNNNVYNLTTSGATMYGIYDAGTGTTNCYKNQVYNLTVNNTFATLYGFYITTGTSNYVYNNFVSDLKTPTSGSTTGLAGMYVSGGTSVGLYYNTIYLNASSSGTNFGSSGIYASTTPTVDLRNNVVVNTSTANGTGFTVAYRRSTTTLTTYASTSNANDFYAGTPSTTNLIYYDGTNSDQTIVDFKTRVSPRDASSFSENPPFVNVATAPYNLHINPSVATQLESGGVPVTSPVVITDDFDGNTRNATSPDIGADEGAFTGVDLTGPTITYTALGNGIVATSRAFNNVTITDASGVNTTSGTKPRVYYKKSTDANDASGWTYVEADNSSSPFNFTLDYSLLLDGSVSEGDTIQYFVVAQDLASTPNVSINSGSFANPQSSVNLASDAFPIGGTINKFAIVGTISGAKTVGSGGDYPSLSGAGGLFADINSKVVSGNITVTILDNLSEDGTNPLNQWSEEGGPWTLTISPASASNKTISGSFAGGLIRLNGADRVTIDGRYSGSGSWLTFQNTSTSSSAVFMLMSLGTGQGATNNTIRNCNISTGTSSAITYGIHIGGSTLGSSGADNDDNSILYNTITVASNGIYAFGTASSSSGGLDNLTVTGNSVTCSTSVAAIGIRVSNILGSTISGNEVDVQQSVSNAPVGISLEAGVNTTTVSSNIVKRSAYTGTNGYGGRGITVGTGLVTSNITLVNNVVYGVTGDNYSSFGYSSSMGIGIGVDGNTSTLSTNTGGVNLYYNSVNMYNSFTSTTSTITTAIYIGSGASNLDIRNNIFANSMDNLGNTTSKSYAIYSAAPASAFTTINYNDYYASGPEGVLGFISSANVTTLSAWQTATGQDANSISSDPQFVSETNLKPFVGSPVLAAGTPITGITIDIEGNTRSGTAPSIGAYENGVTPTSLNFCNLSSPANATINEGQSVAIYAKVYQPGVTDSTGQGTGIEAWIGWHNANTDPSTWTNWVAATYVEDSSGYDKYVANIGSNLTIGTYYYASRFKITGGSNQYGGYSSSGGGFWDGTNNVSGVLTVNELILSVPYYQNFDSVSAPNLPPGWVVENANSDGETWVNTSGNALSSPNAMKYSYDINNSANDWFFSPGFYLQSGVTYEVRFYYRAQSASYPEALKVHYGTSKNSTGMVSPPIFNNNNIINIAYQLGSGTFTPSSTGVYYLGWHCYSAADQYYLYVDDIEIRVQPAVTNNQTISAGSTAPVEFTGTGVTIQFTTANSNSMGVSVDKINAAPGGTLPTGVQNIAPVYWSITITSGTLDGTFSLTLDISGVPGVTNPSTLRLLKRDNAGANWIDLGTPNSVNGTLLTWNGLTSFSEHGIGGGGDNPLPVELSSFIANVKGRDVILNWETKIEISSLKFEIERKSEKNAIKNWLKIGEVDASGNSNSPKTYSFVDKKLNSGMYEYRLKIVDIDGSFEYSDVVKVDIDKPLVYDASQNYPNPFNPLTKIDYQLPEVSKVRLELYDITGQLVKVLVDNLQVEGYYTYNLDMSNLGLSSGVYFYRFNAIGNSGSKFNKITKMIYLK